MSHPPKVLAYVVDEMYYCYPLHLLEWQRAVLLDLKVPTLLMNHVSVNMTGFSLCFLKTGKLHTNYIQRTIALQSQALRLGNARVEVACAALICPVCTFAV